MLLEFKQRFERLTSGVVDVNVQALEPL